MATATSDSIVKTPVVEINLIGMVRRRWPKIVFGVIVGVALSAMYYFSTEKMYESRIEILVGQRSSEVTNNGTLNRANASGDAIQEDQLATHMRLFASRKMLADAIKRGELSSLASFRDAKRNGINGIDLITNNLVVLRGGEGEANDAMVLRATYRDASPENAAIVLNAVYDSYRNYVESHGHNSTAQAVELITQARESHELELADADQAYRDFVRSVPVLIEGDNVKDVHKDRLQSLEKELNSVATSLAGSRSRLEVIQSYTVGRDASSLAKVDHLALLSQKEVERLKLFLDMTRGETQSAAFQADQPIRAEAAKAQYNRLLDLIQKQYGLSEAFGPGHPLVEAVQQEIEITRQFISTNAPANVASATKKLDPAEMLETYTSLLTNDISEMEKRRSFLTAASERELMLAKQIENDFMQGSSLRSRLNRAQIRYDEVIRRLQELTLSRSYAGFSTDLLASPEVPSGAAWPKLPIVGAIGLFLGLVLGFAIAATSEILDSTFSDVADLEKSIGAPAIAHVPQFDPKSLRKRVLEKSRVQPSLVTFHAPRSAESEIYRVARTAMMISNRKDEIKTMMMTSPQPGDGKSTTISNLAISFARTGKRVLLVDADMRRPVISSLFAIDGVPGLSDLLIGQATADDAIQTSEISDLDVMPNGIATPSPAELLEAPRFGMFLTEMASKYDLVMIDAPPLLAVADPAIIAPVVDTVVLTVRIARNGRRPVEQATKILNDLGIRPSAVIVNGVDQEATKYGYGNYSRDGYGYVGHYHDRYSAPDAPQEPLSERAPRVTVAPLSNLGNHTAVSGHTSLTP